MLTWHGAAASLPVSASGHSSLGSRKYGVVLDESMLIGKATRGWVLAESRSGDGVSKGGRRSGWVRAESLLSGA
jgi:hypothetical protein